MGEAHALLGPDRRAPERNASAGPATVYLRPRETEDGLTFTLREAIIVARKERAR